MNPNKPEQDGLRIPLLGDCCESRLSACEKATAEQVFRPLHIKPSRTVSYGPWFLRFCVSVSWRVLTAYLQRDVGHLSSDQLITSDSALRVWRDYLLDRRQDIAGFEQHALPLDVVADLGGMNAPSNFNRYLLRAVDIDVAAHPRSAVVYSKMCGLLVIGFIDIAKPQEWKGTKVEALNGTLGPRDYEVPAELGSFLIAKARKMAASQSAISRRQRDRLATRIMTYPDRVASSESFRVFCHDVMLFGRQAFELEHE